MNDMKQNLIDYHNLITNNTISITSDGLHTMSSVQQLFDDNINRIHDNLNYINKYLEQQNNIENVFKLTTIRKPYFMRNKNASIRDMDNIQLLRQYWITLSDSRFISSDMAITIEDIKKIHSFAVCNSNRVKKDCVAGHFRTTKMMIGNQSNIIKHVKTIAISPNDLTDSMEALVQSYNENTSSLPDILQVAEFYLKYLLIHPFEDGNGRTARLLLPILLYKKNIIKHPVLFVAPTYGKNQGKHNLAIYRAYKENNINIWFQYFLDHLLSELCRVIQNIEKMDVIKNMIVNKECLLVKHIDLLMELVLFDGISEKQLIDIGIAVEQIESFLSEGIVHQLCGKGI